MDIKHLHLVKAIAQKQNLTRAAAALNLSQPAASQQLRELEAQLDTVLFHRTGKKMVLTSSGEKVLASANIILAELNAMEYEISKIVQGESGELKIGIHCSFSFQWIPDAIMKFREAYPNVRLSVGNSWKTLKDLMAKSWDIIITTYPFPHEALRYTRLIEDDVMVIMAPGHLLSQKAYLEPKDFEKESYLSLTTQDHDIVWKNILLPAGADPESFMTIEQPNAIMSLVQKGFGLSFFPRWVIRKQVESGMLSARKFTPKGLSTVWNAVRLSSDSYPAYHDAFLNIAKNHLEEMSVTL